MHIDINLQLLLNNSVNQVRDFSIALLDVHGFFLFWNKGATILDGYEANEIIGQPLTTLHPPTEKEEKLGEYMLEHAVKEGRVKQIGKRMTKSGTIYLASVVINAIFDQAGKHIGYIRIASSLGDNVTYR
jgi:PAS domain S-box-containing protein